MNIWIPILVVVALSALGFAAYVYFSHRDLVTKHAEAMLAKWKEKEERNIKEDAFRRSRAVSFGKTIEHFVPFMEDFPVDPREAKFFGKPIDFIAFTNPNSRKKCTVHFIEIKSGSSTLNARQSNIRDAVRNGRIKWHEFNVDGIWDFEEPLEHMYSPEAEEASKAVQPKRKRGRPKKEN